MKRAYFVTSDLFEDGYGLAIIANTIKEAKLKVEYDEFISIKAKWIRKDVSHLPYGEVGMRDGIINGLYGYVEIDCEECGEEYCMTDDNVKDGKVICEECLEKVKAQKEAVEFIEAEEIEEKISSGIVFDGNSQEDF